MFYNANATSQYDDLFQKHSQAYGVRYDFARNIAQIESNYKADAKAKTTSATGVMQLVKGTGQEMGLQTDADFLDPDKNIGAGVKYLSQCLKLSNGNEMRAALCYHSGPASKDVIHFDKGEYDQISHWGQDYLTKVAGNAQGDPHATDRFNTGVIAEVPKQEPQAMEYQSPLGDGMHVTETPTPTNASGLSGINAVNNQPFKPTNEPVEGIDKPVEALPGTPPAQQEDDSFLGNHGFAFAGDATKTAAYNSEIGTMGEAATSMGWSGVGNLIKSKVAQPQENIDYLRNSGLRQEYWSIVNGSDKDHFKGLVDIALKHQQRDDDLAGKHVGVGSAIGAGAIGLISNPSNLVYFLQPEAGGAALAEKAGGPLAKWAINAVTKVGKNAAYDATMGTLGTLAHTSITGGDFSAKEAAVNAVMFGAGIRGATKGASFTWKALRSPEEVFQGFGRSKAPVVEGPVPHSPEEATANRLAHSESARNLNEPDPTLKTMVGDEKVRVNSDDTAFAYANPKEEQEIEENVLMPDGKTIDAANPLNPHTQDVHKFIEEEADKAIKRNAKDLLKEVSEEGTRYRAAHSFGTAVRSGMQKLFKTDFGNATMSRILGMEELGTAATHYELSPSLRGFGLGLVNPAQGIRDVMQKAGGWVGQRLGKMSALEIVESEEKSDINTFAALKRAEKKMVNIPEYQFQNTDGSMLTPLSDDVKLELMKRDASRAIRAGDLSTLAPEVKEYAEILQKHYNVDKASKLVDPSMAYGHPDAQPILDKSTLDGKFLPSYYDRNLKNDYLQFAFNGDEEAFQNALTDGDMQAYLTNPEVKAKVDEYVQREHMSEDNIKKVQTQIKNADAEAKQAVKDVEKAKKELDAAGDKNAYREQKVQDALKKAGYETEQDIQQTVEKEVQKAKARYKKNAPDEEALFKREREKIQKKLDKIATEADEAAKSHYENLEKRLRGAERRQKSFSQKAKSLTDSINKPLTKEQLLEGAQKLAHDLNYGVVKDLETDPSTLQAVQNALEKNELAGMSTANSLKTRSPFGYQGKMRLPDGSFMTKEDLLTHDTDRVFHVYNRQMNGHLAINGAYGVPFDEFAKGYNALKKELTDVPHGVEPTRQQQIDRDGFKATDEVLKRITGRSRVKDPNSLMRSLTKLVSTYTYSTKNGWFGYDNLGEANSLYYRTAAQKFEDMFSENIEPIIRGAKDQGLMVNQMKDALFGDEVLRDLTSTTANMKRSMMESGLSEGTANILAKSQNVANNIAFYNAGNLALHYSINKIVDLAESQTLGSVVREVVEGKQSIYLNHKMFRSAGLTDEQGATIKQLIADHAGMDAQGNLFLKNKQAFLKDSRTAMLRRLTRRVAKDTLLLEDAAQTMVRPATAVEQMCWMFKRFGMKAMNAKMMRNWHEAVGNGRGMEKALELASGLFVQWGLNRIKTEIRASQMNKIDGEHYRQMMNTPAMQVYGTISRLPMLSLVGNINTALSIGGYDFARNLRSSQMPVPPTHRSTKDTQLAMQEQLGKGIVSNVPVLATAIDGYTLAKEGLRYTTASDHASKANAAYLIRDAMLHLTPMNNPLLTATQKAMFEHTTGLSYSGQKPH